MIARLPAYPGLPQARAPRLTTPVVIGVSIALHAGLLAYLAVQKFTAPSEDLAPPDPITNVTMPDWKPVELVHSPVAPPPIHTPPHNYIPTTTPPLQVDPPIQPATDPRPIDVIPTNLGPTLPITAPDPVITSPSWVRKPGPKEFARFYPDRAVRLEKSGSAVLACKVTSAGAVVGCQVASETPETFGFGEAALKLAPYFQLSPPTQDGKPIEGAGIRIPIRFSLGG